MPSTIRNYRWIIVILLFLATTINYLDRQLIGILKPILETEFSWSETDYAHIVMAFTAAYAIGLFVVGRFIDTVGTKIGYAVTITCWSIAGMLHAIAGSAFDFGLARICLGLGEAGNFPAAAKSVAEWFPKKERAPATGIFNAGTSVGVVAAFIIAPWILSSYGWKEVFWITGALGFVWLIFWLLFYEVPARQKRLSQEEYRFIISGQELRTQEAGAEKPVKWLRLFTFRQTWAVITGKGLIDPIFWFSLYWLPSYFSTAFKLDLKKLSPELIIIYTATTVGSIAGGYLSSLLIKKGWPILKARKTVLFVFAILELFIIFVQFATDVWVVVALISLAVGIHQAWATNVFTLPSDMFPKQAVSTVVGIAGMAGAVGGIFFPILVGYLLDYYKAAGDVTEGYKVLFTICGFTYLFAWAIMHLLTRRARAIHINELT